MRLISEEIRYALLEDSKTYNLLTNENQLQFCLNLLLSRMRKTVYSIKESESPEQRVRLPFGI